MKKRTTVMGLVMAIFAIAVLFYIEQVIQPGYWGKSICKLTLFLGCIFIYCWINHVSFKEKLRLKKPKKAKLLYICMALAYLGIVICFFIFRNFMDTESIKNNLMSKENLTKQNCLFVFAYIMICNSFLEESFFRGFITGLFENRKLGMIVSGLLFALYHIGIVSSWFNPILLVICIGGLAVVGIVLQLISDHYQSLVASWMIHGCANLAINTIGAFLIFGL